MRIVEFGRHWYIDGSFWFLHSLQGGYKNLEQTLALRATIYHIREPLYGDYTWSGRIIGFVFRVLRILLALVLYFLLVLISAISYAAWLTLPIYLLVRVVV